MRSFVSELAYSGDYITPHELNGELAELVGAFHGLDRDNTDNGVLTAAKVAVGAWNVYAYATKTTTRQSSAGESTSKLSKIPIINEAGTGQFSLTIETGDGMLKCGLSIGVSRVGGSSVVLGICIGILVDGGIIGWSPLVTHESDASMDFDCAVFVGAGIHDVSAVFQHPYAGIAGVTDTFDFKRGLLWARGVNR